jgi:hypothetical protein
MDPCHGHPRRRGQRGSEKASHSQNWGPMEAEAKPGPPYPRASQFHCIPAVWVLSVHFPGHLKMEGHSKVGTLRESHAPKLSEQWLELLIHVGEVGGLGSPLAQLSLWLIQLVNLMKERQMPREGNARSVPTPPQASSLKSCHTFLPVPKCVPLLGSNEAAGVRCRIPHLGAWLLQGSEGGSSCRKI